jgi:hypothetical protein
MRRRRRGRRRHSSSSMKTTISEPPTTLHGSSQHQTGTMENISLKKVDVKFSLFMPYRHIG